MINKASKQFDLYLKAQLAAISAIKTLANVDRSVVSELFNVSSTDASIIHVLQMDKVLSIAEKNSGLFFLQLPHKSEISDVLKQEDLLMHNYASREVKSAVSHYRDAQLKALVAVKNIFDDNPLVARSLIFMSSSAADILESMSINELINLSQRYAWILQMNYPARNDIFHATAEVRKHPRAFVESAVLY